MNAEEIIHKEQNQTILRTPILSEVKFSGRVDINHLIARARKIKEKENKTNLVFFCLFSVLIVFVGILLSL